MTPCQFRLIFFIVENASIANCHPPDYLLLLAALSWSCCNLSWLRTLGAVLAPALLPVVHASCVKCAPDDGVTNTWKVLYPAATYQHDGVLLEVVAFTWDVSNDFNLVGQANLCNFAERRVRLLWRRGVHPGANATALWASAQRTRFAGDHNFLSSFTD